MTRRYIQNRRGGGPRCKYCERPVLWVTNSWGDQVPCEVYVRYAIPRLGGAYVGIDRAGVKVFGELLPLDEQEAHRDRAVNRGEKVIGVWVPHLDRCTDPRGRGGRDGFATEHMQAETSKRQDVETSKSEGAAGERLQSDLFGVG